ncbi:prolyl oligopeptidase family serine peptidase [Gramella sp. AN32]|uniref:Prolyl oligopeptidase family serine peptidase n=1 Tax=Christiangramia antarctica TaxID=2058158 RepID=A0ABW5X2W6_9FLAO|nr:prolyl oligopeptidase family serine peptidase [Gramella sp. AN32]MCM4155774.1 phospholipase [Gramella sp. AN32]
MKYFTLLFFCLFTQFVLGQISYVDGFSEGNSIAQHDREFYVKNTTAYKYSDDKGNTMSYRLFLPADYNPNKKYPLVLSLHGAGSRGNDNLKQLCPWVAGWIDKEVQREHPCIILMPQCPSNEQWVNVPWKNGSYNMKEIPLSTPMKLAKEILDKVILENSVDKDRVYVIGVSMGGYGTWNFITRYHKMIAAAVPVCGAGDPSMAQNIKNLPIWAFHGDKDTTVPLSGSMEMVKALNRFKKHQARLTIYKGVGHKSYELAWKNPGLIDWLFSQKKND